MGDGNKDNIIYECDGTVYSKDYFLDSTEPYEKLYGIQNSFERARELTKTATIAGKCGVRNFKALFADYCKSMALANNQNYAENTTNFTGQDLELNTGQWVADDLGITRFGVKGYEEVACVHPIMPVERLVNIDTGIEKTRMAYCKGGVWRHRICDRSQLANARSIIGLADYGVAVTSENAKFLVQYICDVENLNYSIIPEHNSVSRLGWIGQNDFSPYVDNLIFDGDITFKDFYDAVSEEGDASEWLEYVKKIRAENIIPTKIMLAASFASALVAPCNCLVFFVHLWGGSGNGKTVALMLATSVWASPKVGDYIHTFNSTDVAQELSAGFVNSMPLVLDELQIKKAENKKDFDAMIYKLSEGVGRKRGAKTGGLQRMQTWKNSILTSGETPITSAHSGGGAVNRIIEINTENMQLFSDSKHAADFFIGNYGHAGRWFIEELMKPDVMETAKKMQKDFFNRLSGKEITEKQIVAASLILTADALIDAYIFKDGNGLSIREVADFLATNDDVSADKRAYDWLLDWIAQNNRKFSGRDDVPEVWGKKNIDKIFIIRDVFNKACSDNGYNATSFLAWLKREGLIEAEGRAYTKRVRINGMKCQCVVLKAEDVPEGFRPVPEEEQIEF